MVDGAYATGFGSVTQDTSQAREAENEVMHAIYADAALEAYRDAGKDGLTSVDLQRTPQVKPYKQMKRHQTYSSINTNLFAKGLIIRLVGVSRRKSGVYVLNDPDYINGRPTREYSSNNAKDKALIAKLQSENKALRKGNRTWSKKKNNLLTIIQSGEFTLDQIYEALQ